MNAKLPEGWWRIDSAHKGHKGEKSAVLDEIRKDELLSPEWKAALTQQIEKLDCAALEVHAHAQQEHGEFILSLHLKKLF